MSGELAFYLPSRRVPGLVEDRARDLVAGARAFLSALDDEFAEVRTEKEREWCRDVRRYLDDFFGDALAKAGEFAFPDPADVEADRACDRMREVA